MKLQPNKKICVAYDAMCRLRAHLCAIPEDKRPVDLTKVTLAIPAWHAKSHTEEECQVTALQP